MDQRVNRGETRRSELSRRKRIKQWALPWLGGMLGLALSIFAGFAPLDALIELIPKVLSPEAIVKWADAHPWALSIASWIAAPVTLFLLLLGISRIVWVERLVDHVFPDPPLFVFKDLATERAYTMSRLERAALPLIGREVELAGLIAGLLDNRDREPFRWQLLTGPSGIGKSRLAIEWLAAAEARGWDYGVIDPQASESLAEWNARRPTALVIDEANTLWAGKLEIVLEQLQASAGKKRSVSVLVLGQLAPYARGATPEPLKGSEAEPPIALEPLSPASLTELAAALTPDGDKQALVCAESAGRPRAAIILANSTNAASLAEALAEWSFRLIPELRVVDGRIDDAEAAGLVLAGFAGPLKMRGLAEYKIDISAHSLLRFFPDQSAEALEDELPALLPDDLGREIGLRLLARLTLRRREDLLSYLVAHQPAALEATLGALWCALANDARHSEAASRTALLRSIQERFDNFWPDRAASFIERIGGLVDISARADTAVVEMRNTIRMARMITQVRPFDPEIVGRYLSICANAAACFGKRLDFAAVEALGSEMRDHICAFEFQHDPHIHRTFTRGCSNIIFAYSEADRPDDLERWLDLALHFPRERGTVPEYVGVAEQQILAIGNALPALGRARRIEEIEQWATYVDGLRGEAGFHQKPALAEAVASTLGAAHGAFGRAGRVADMRRWEQILLPLFDDPALSSSVDMQRSDLNAAANSVDYYGRLKHFGDVARWEKRIAAIATKSADRFDAPLLSLEARACANAICHCANQENWKVLERWGYRLFSISERLPPGEHHDIPHWQIGGIANAFNHFGEAGRFDELERWGDRIPALRAIDPESEDLAHMEAACCVNAMDSYGRAKRLQDLERWGERLAAISQFFSSSSVIARQEAMGAAIALDSYDSAGLSGVGKAVHWKMRLALLAQKYRAEPRIQLIAKERNVSVLEQEKLGYPFGKGDIITEPG